MYWLWGQVHAHSVLLIMNPKIYTTLHYQLRVAHVSSISSRSHFALQNCLPCIFQKFVSCHNHSNLQWFTNASSCWSQDKFLVSRGKVISLREWLLSNCRDCLPCMHHFRCDRLIGCLVNWDPGETGECNETNNICMLILYSIFTLLTAYKDISIFSIPHWDWRSCNVLLYKWTLLHVGCMK